jgi:peptidoglycan/xylan/chitin deacetylase (PgdA/CDA1 family)
MSAGIDLVVAIRADGEPVGECIEALQREAGEGLRLVRAATGWQARQEALAGSTADVIAFVDPDVVVPDGWLARLRAAWEASPHSVAAVGGPIRGDAPEWAAARLGLIDLGAGVLELDPAERTLFGGNLSFWRRALLGVGGFAPPVDGRDATDWLSEEHEAQRQLGHWGWLIRYEPALAARRVVASPGALRRSWRYGVRSGIAGSRRAGPPLRQGLRSGAGAVAALARGRRADALERAARSAENVGVVIGARRSAHADTSGTGSEPIDPAAPAAIADPSIRSARSTLGRHTRLNVDLVLLYHRFATAQPDPLGLCVSPANFKEQLALLRERFEVVPLAAIAETVRSVAPGSGRIAITIDDGYVDNLTGGIPLIAEAGLPATLFAATGHIETGRPFFWDEMQRLLTGPGPRPAQLRIGEWTWPTATPEQRETARKELHRLTQPRSSQQIEQTLRALRTWAGSAAGDPPESTRPVTVEELQQIAATPGIEIGAHTRDHVNLAHHPADEIQAQIERSRDDVASWTGARPRAFSYPFGIPRHDVSDEARRIAAGAGFEYAVVNQPVPVQSGADRFAIPRLFAPDLGRDRFIAWLQGVLN